MMRLIGTVCTVLLATSLSAVAQTGFEGAPAAYGNEDSMAAGDPSEGETLEFVAVPPGGGDGRLTERDARAFSSWCVWGFREALASEGITTPLAPNAEALMLDFWFYVWEYVDAETKATISQADVLWEQHQQTWQTADEFTKQMFRQQFAGFLQTIWGGVEMETVQYLTGQLNPGQYALVIDQAVTAQSGGVGGGAGNSDGYTGSDALIPGLPSPGGVVYDDTHVINDGSGDIMFSDPY